MEIVRSYTVVLSSLDPNEEDSGRNIHLIIKTYDNGAITPKIKALKIGIDESEVLKLNLAN